MQKIILTGYMGSGKTVIGSALAQKLQLPHLDLDAVIESSQQMPIAEIFAKKGEIFFRKIEHQTLSELVNSADPFVLSLGGGTPCYANNDKMLRLPNVVSVYLKASIETLAKRLQNETQKRPLLASDEAAGLHEFIAKHLFDRSYYYNQALYTINVDGKTIDAIVSEICQLA